MKTLINIFLFFCLPAVFISCNDDEETAPGPIVYPTFSQGSGTYENPITVEIASNVEGSDLYYTTDGSLPSASSTKYTGPIEVDSDMQLKAIAIENGAGESQIGGVSYTFKTATPEVSVAPGAIEFSQNVTLSSGTDGAQIYYTLDGSDPSQASLNYSGELIWVDSTLKQLKATAYKNNYAQSDVLTAEYDIVLSPVSKIYWYAAEDVSGPDYNPFPPHDEIINNFEVTLNTTTKLTTVPLEQDIVVMADTYSGAFDLSEFQGKVIVTYSNSIQAFMDDFLSPTSNSGSYFTSGSTDPVNWINPAAWGSENGATIGSAVLDQIANDEVVSFVKRGDVIHGTSTAGDAVIVYEVKKGDKQWYWIHIGAFDGSFPQRASEVLKYTLNRLMGKE